MKPGRTIAAGNPRSRWYSQDEGFGLGLGAGVGIERIGGGGHGLVGPVVVAAFVDAERADVNEALEPASDGGFEQQAKGLDVQPAELLERSPVAHLGGAVEHPIGPGDSRFERSWRLPGRRPRFRTPH